MCVCVCVVVIQLCLTLGNTMDCRPPGSSVHGILWAKNTGVGSHSLLHVIFPTQGLNPGLLHCRQVLYHLSHQGSGNTPFRKLLQINESESCSVVSNSLWPMDYTVHGILQARKLEWIAFPFSRVSSQPRDSTQVSHIAGRFLTSWATREAHCKLIPTYYGKFERYKRWQLFYVRAR